MTTIDFVFFDAGGGHRSAATALAGVIESQNRPWRVRLVNLQEILDPIDIFRRLTGTRFQDVYNLLLKKGWTLGTTQILPALHGLLRLYHRSQVRLLEAHWRAQPPDLVVSLVPHFNRALREGFHRARPGAPFVTVLTDLADYPPHFWIERQEQYIIAGSPRAHEQALRLGHSPDRVFLASGMILRPSFYRPLDVDRAAERARLHLEPERATGLVLFGGQGASVMLDIARRLQHCRRPLQLILLAGHNRRLTDRLRRLASRIPMHVEGFTTEVPYFMHLSDFLIGKPGPGSISEALAMKLPVIVERTSWTLPQERYNADWILENRLGLVTPGFRRIAETVDHLLDPATLAEYCVRAAGVDNRAVFEIPDMLARILSQSAAR